MSMILAGCATNQLEIVPANNRCIYCDIIKKEPSESILDTNETRLFVKDFYKIWICVCEPELAKERKIKCQ